MRADISDYIIHFTKGENDDDAFNNLWSILKDGRITSHTNFIRGLFPCVCFTEAPLDAVKDGFMNLFGEVRYSPFGVKFHKNYIFAMGGRPVIYSPDHEYEALGEEVKWRHVRYELPPDRTIDFTWEREWRLECESLPISSEICAVVVPDGGWAERLIKRHDDEQNHKCTMYAQVLGPEAYGYAEPFRWEISVLRG